MSFEGAGGRMRAGAPPIISQQAEHVVLTSGGWDGPPAPVQLVHRQGTSFNDTAGTHDATHCHVCGLHNFAADELAGLGAARALGSHGSNLSQCPAMSQRQGRM